MVLLHRSAILGYGFKAVIKAQRNKCFYCHRKFTGVTPTRDHLIPRYLGTSLVGNIVAACPDCNQKKGATMPDVETIKRAQAVMVKAGLPAFGIPVDARWQGMNPAHFGEWELDQIDWLASHGVPRDVATRIMSLAKDDAMREARDAEDDRQFLIEYKQHGSATMGRRYGYSQEWARKRFNKLIDQQNPQHLLAPKLQTA